MNTSWHIVVLNLPSWREKGNWREDVKLPFYLHGFGLLQPNMTHTASNHWGFEYKLQLTCTSLYTSTLDVLSAIFYFSSPPKNDKSDSSLYSINFTQLVPQGICSQCPLADDQSCSFGCPWDQRQQAHDMLQVVEQNVSPLPSRKGSSDLWWHLREVICSGFLEAILISAQGSILDKQAA